MNVNHVFQKNTACIETTVFATWRASPGFAKSKPQKMVSFRTGDVSANVADQACLRPRVSQFSLVPTGGWPVSLFGVDLGILIHRPFCNVWFANWGGRAGFATCAFTVRHGGMSPFSRQHSASWGFKGCLTHRFWVSVKAKTCHCLKNFIIFGNNHHIYSSSPPD